MPFSLAYRRALAVLCVAGSYTGLLNYLFLTGSLSVRPAVLIVAFFFLSLPFLVVGASTKLVLATPIMAWCGLYAAMTVLWFMTSSQSTVAAGELVSRLLSVTFIGTVTLILADSRVHDVARWSVLWSVLLGIGFNVYDLLRPLTFSPLVGRAAGLYLNPNTAAAALVLGMIVSVDVLPERLRTLFVGLVGAGVLLTFSRSGAAAWVLATAVLAGSRVIRIAGVVRVMGVIALLGLGVLYFTGSLEPAVQMASVVSSDAWGRLRVGERTMDFSAEARLGDAGEAWAMFLDRPFSGHGIGATAEWDRFESTHNIYLRHLAEYGVAGLAIVPLLALSVLWPPSRKALPHSAVGIIVVVIVLGVTSHNLLDERHVLIALAIGAALVAAGVARRSAPPPPHTLVDTVVVFPARGPSRSHPWSDPPVPRG